jgi:serine protease AprX
MSMIHRPGKNRAAVAVVAVALCAAVSSLPALAADGPDGFVLELKYARFDPLGGAAPAVDPLLAADRETSLYIVQFQATPSEADRQAVRDAGAEVLQYLVSRSHIVRMDRAARAAVEALPSVRWVGPYHPAYRLDPPLRAALMAGDALGDQRYLIHVTRPGPDEKETVAERIREMGGVIDKLTPHGYVLQATLSPDQLIEVVHMNEVLFIDPWRAPQTYMNNVRIDGGANYVESVAGYTGQGVRAEVMDGGLLTSHQDFQSNPPIIHVANGPSTWHGTSVYGIVFGDGTGNPTGRGMLPDAQGIFSAYGSLGDRYQHIMELVADPYNAVFQTNSWGSCCTTQYGVQAADMDLIIFDSDFLLLQAQANEGSQNSDVIAFAKNIVSVGGIQHFDTLSRADDQWGFAGSIGPAADGRIKPDLAYWYDHIFTTSDDGSYTASFGGTSAATPETAGHFGLMFQMWSEGIFGNPVTPGGTVFENRPHRATAKALMVNTAEPYEFTGPTHDLTRVHQGWGLANVANLYDTRDKILVVDEEDVLTDGQSIAYVAAVGSGEPRLKATLVYLDPPGNPASSVARINDLSLKVTSPGGTVYWGNNGLQEGNVSTPGGSPNDVDTVENVWIENPQVGTWTVEVIAHEIVEDSHVETPQIDADFALVVSGAEQGPGFGLAADPPTQNICAPADASYDLTIEQFMGFTEPVTLSASGAPSGTTVSLSDNPVVPPATSTLTVSDTGAAAAGDYLIEVTGVAPSMERTILVGLDLYTAIPDTPSLTSPANGAVDVSLVPTLQWTPSAQAALYELQVATDSAFANVVYAADAEEDTHQIGTALDILTEYFWRVRATNTCGDSPFSTTFSFTTQDIPPVLLVDDDDNGPDVRSYYTDTLDAMGVWHDVWDTNNSDDEPSAQDLAPYRVVIWFTGDEFGGACGPGPAGEAALAEWLDTGGCLFISSQDYFYDRGLTGFMQTQLGVLAADSDVGQTTVTGAGSVFGGMGPYALSYPFTNYSDIINPRQTLAFSGDQGDAGVINEATGYHTTFWGFPFEAISDLDDRIDLLQTIFDWCSGLEPDCPGDIDGDGTVGVIDFLEMLAAWGPNPGHPADLDGDDEVGVTDFLELLAVWGPCP